MVEHDQRRIAGSDDHVPGLALRSANGRLALIATVAASGMASLDATVVNVALPQIGRDFDARVGALQWVLTSYLIALASLILLGGALGDRFGRRKLFVIGTVIFAAASLACGAAPSIQVLVAARIFQGIGGALLTPGSLAILQASFRPTDRAAAVGAWSGLGGVAGAIGPFLGGWLVDGPGWRWAFLINVPVAAICIACAYAAVPETRDPYANRHVDMRGALFAVVGLGASTWALIEVGQRGAFDLAVVAAGIVATAAIAAFVWGTLRASDPLVPPSLFRSRTFTVVNLQTVLLYAALGVSFFLVSLELQIAADWSALGAGLALLPVTLLMLCFSAASGSLAQRIGPRTQLTVGPLLTGIGLLLLSRIGPDASWLTHVLPGATILGFGLVTFVAPLTATVMAAADPNSVSVASGVNNAIARAASLVALAAIPVMSGLSTASGALEISASYRVAMIIAACIAAAAAPLGYVGLSRSVQGLTTARRVHCSVDGTPLQPNIGTSNVS